MKDCDAGWQAGRQAGILERMQGPRGQEARSLLDAFDSKGDRAQATRDIRVLSKVWTALLDGEHGWRTEWRTCDMCCFLELCLIASVLIDSD